MTINNTETGQTVGYGGGTIYTYNATPVLNGISPSTIQENQSTLVTFNGTGFGSVPPTLTFSPASVVYSLQAAPTRRLSFRLTLARPLAVTISP